MRTMPIRSVAFALRTPGIALALALLLSCAQAQASSLCSMPPIGIRTLVVTKAAPDVARITWPTGDLDAYGRDVVRGGLSTLSSSRGDFVVSTELCLIDDAQTVSVDDPQVPAPGDGFWYAVREDQHEGCPAWGAQSYDEPRSAQAGSRDLEILNSTHDCTCFFWCCVTYNSCE